MILVADSSALVALAACDSLSLLDEIFGQVIVPEAVFHEVVRADKFQSNRLKDYLHDVYRGADYALHQAAPCAAPPAPTFKP